MPRALSGSSPLTRGKPSPPYAQHLPQRLIPAHAGKTRGRRSAPRSFRAHPRSRGENEHTLERVDDAWGSSPLTRGKPRVRVGVILSDRLIPAHAGKTSGVRTASRTRGAHPRSRGENIQGMADALKNVGSSPLTRGKLILSARPNVNGGLIPAHAGKTCAAAGDRRHCPAHPRSRGENVVSSSRSASPLGSSPLTRGKLDGIRVRHLPLRLIPAHAGKTHRASTVAHPGWAHPRSRGENPGLRWSWDDVVGSSPLTRGKLNVFKIDDAGARLIPAHAGKTNSRGRPDAWQGAHPRSRGENGVQVSPWNHRVGSSPLTRGKLDIVPEVAAVVGLIPAHAGKTYFLPRTARPCRAHPRSRGENTSRPALLLRRSIRSWKPLSLPSPLEVTQFGSLAQLTRRRIRFGVLASSFRVVGAHHECESIEVNGLPGIAPRQEGESLLVARTKDHDSPTRFHVLSDDVPQALAYTGAERPHEDPRGNLHEPPRHVTSQPLGHRGQDQDDHQESLSS